MNAIHLENVVKTFTTKAPRSEDQSAVGYFFRPKSKSTHALNGVSFQIDPGERVAFVGPNGAGKSTTIKIMAGIQHATSGTVKILGKNPAEHRKKLAYKIGTVFGQRSQLWTHLPAQESFTLLSYIYDLNRTEYKKRIDELIQLFSIEHLVSKPVHQLSLGERMRCEIVASLIHQPSVLFFDEPSIGLDVSAKATIRDFIKAQSEREGSTLLLTSHDVGDMEQVCDRVIMIHQGRIIIDSQLQQLRRQYIKKKRLVVLTGESQCHVGLPGVTQEDHKKHETTFSIDLETTTVGLVIEHLVRHFNVKDMVIEDPPLEAIINKIYKANEFTGRL